MNEPQTLTEADVVGIPTGNPDTRTPDPYLDGVADYLKGGSLTGAEIVRRVFQNPEPDQGAVDALERQLGNDPRFVAMADGWDLVGLPPAEGKSIADCMAASEATADKLADPCPDGTPECPPVVQAVEGTGSETIASETPAPSVVVVDERDEQIRSLKRKLRAARDELAAHQEREEREKELTGDITKASKDVEAAKEVLAGKKAALATAHEQLFLFASGDTQTSHPALKGEDDEEGDEDEQGRPAPVMAAPVVAAPAAPVAPAAVAADATPAPVKPFEHAVAADQVVPDHGLDLLSLRARLRRDLPAAEKPHQIGPAVFECRGCQWLLRDVNDDETRWFAQRVLSKDEWNQLHEKEFGMCVEGFDQNEEAKHHRTQGGEDNGRVVRVGKKKGVMGPEREGLVLTLPAAEVPAPFDAKSAAANDTVEEHKEEGEHVSGNTVGGCVHSNPND